MSSMEDGKENKQITSLLQTMELSSWEKALSKEKKVVLIENVLLLSEKAV